MSCVQSDEDLVVKNNWGLAISCLGIAIVVFSRTTLSLVKNLSYIENEEWDLAMVTINDYTIQVKMTPNMWNHFR